MQHPSRAHLPLTTPKNKLHSPPRTRKHGDDLGAARLQLGHNAVVVAVVASHLQNKHTKVEMHEMRQGEVRSEKLSHNTTQGRRGLPLRRQQRARQC